MAFWMFRLNRWFELGRVTECLDYFTHLVEKSCGCWTRSIDIAVVDLLLAFDVRFESVFFCMGVGLCLIGVVVGFCA